MIWRLNNNTDKQGNLSELPTLAPVFFLVSCRKKSRALDPGTHSPGCWSPTLSDGKDGVGQAEDIRILVNVREGRSCAKMNPFASIEDYAAVPEPSLGPG